MLRARIDLGSCKISNGLSHLPEPIARAVAPLRDAANDARVPAGTRRKIADATFCTVVYHACGSCQFGDQQGYLTEYFCDSDGGSTPDFTQCSPC